MDCILFRFQNLSNFIKVDFMLIKNYCLFIYVYLNARSENDESVISLTLSHRIQSLKIN